MKRLTSFLEFIEASFVEITIRLVSLLAPVPTAAIVVSRTMKYLEWSQPIAIIAGVVIEGFGFSSINLVLTLYQYNQTKRQKDPKAPLSLAITFTVVYILSAIGLTVLLDTLPALARYAPIVFPIISICGAGMMILRYNHASRLQAIVEQKVNEKKERKEAKEQHTKEEVKETKPETTVQAVSKVEQVLAYYKEHPLAKQQEAANEVKVSRQYIGQLLAQFEQEGIIHRNGSGVQILK